MGITNAVTELGCPKETMNSGEKEFSEQFLAQETLYLLIRPHLISFYLFSKGSIATRGSNMLIEQKGNPVRVKTTFMAR